jgi:hypothetical protein
MKNIRIFFPVLGFILMLLSGCGSMPISVGNDIAPMDSTVADAADVEEIPIGEADDYPLSAALTERGLVVANDSNLCFRGDGTHYKIVDSDKPRIVAYQNGYVYYTKRNTAHHTETGKTERSLCRILLDACQSEEVLIPGFDFEDVYIGDCIIYSEFVYEEGRHNRNPSFYRIHRTELDGTEDQVILERGECWFPCIHIFAVYKDRVYYIDATPADGTRGGYLYRMDMDGTNNLLISVATRYADSEPMRFAIVNGYIFYTKSLRNIPYLHRMNLDGTGIVLISKAEYFETDQNAVYFYDGGNIYKTAADNLRVVRIAEADSFWLPDDGYIYFKKDENPDFLYRTRSD